MREYIVESPRKDVFVRLESIYAFREEATVRTFLEKHSFLTPLLLQARAKIGELFGSSIVSLDVAADPEDDKYQELWARIQTDLTPQDALSALTRLDEEWWFEASASSQNLLNIKLEYI